MVLMPLDSLQGYSVTIAWVSGSQTTGLSCLTCVCDCQGFAQSSNMEVGAQCFSRAHLRET